VPGDEEVRQQKSAEHVLYDASVGLRLVGSHLRELDAESSGEPGPPAPPAGVAGDAGTLRPGRGPEETAHHDS